MQDVLEPETGKRSNSDERWKDGGEPKRDVMVLIPSGVVLYKVCFLICFKGHLGLFVKFNRKILTLL